MSCMEDGSHAEKTNRMESIVGDPVGVFGAQPRDEIAMSPILRFNGSVERDPAIDDWMHEHSDE